MDTPNSSADSFRKVLLLLFFRSPKHSAQGFTLIELIMVIVIIAVLAVIAIPSMLNQASKARRAEAKSYIGALNRSQALFYANNQRFSISLDELGIGIHQQTENYRYVITNLQGNQPADPNDPSYKQAIVNWALSIDGGAVHSYLGIADVVSTTGGVGTVDTMICEQGKTGTVNQSGYTSGQNYNVITDVGDPSQSPQCADPFQPLQ